MKSKAKKSPATRKSAAKPAPAKKSAAKPAAKPAARQASKPTAKAVSKPAAKPASKSSAKPVAKTSAKPAGKAPNKASVKPAAAKKPAAKPAAKPTAKAPVKSAGKSAAKTAAKSPAKAPVKTAPKAPAKPASKASAPKAAPKTSKATAKAAPASAPPASKPASKAPTKAQTTPAASQPAAPVAAPAVNTGGVLRAARPSARLAQITVPSMAQAVASTAAKASYLPSMTPVSPAPVAPAAVKRDPKLANNWKTKSAEQLSDAEVLAMPDGEYMNDKQMAFFRLRLLQLKRDILANAGETTEHLREDTVIVPDPADRATIEEEHALELRTRDRERKLLKKIEQSIARIDAGDYGYCDETGEPIGVPRLLARPTATLSLEAQQRRELKQKMFGN